MILPQDRDPRFITIRRRGTLTDSDHQLLALWAATCAEHVLHLFESAQPSDLQPRQAIEAVRAWTRGKLKMMETRALGGHAMGAARNVYGSARFAAYAAGQAVVVAHVAAHELGLRPTPSRLPVQPLLKARVRAPGCLSADGSATSSLMRSANWSWMINGCATTSAGQCSTADQLSRSVLLASTFEHMSGHRQKEPIFNCGEAGK